MRFPNQRLAQLFGMLQNEALPQDELAQRLSVSTRTVRADITALNALLTQYGAQFVLSRGNGYQLKIDDPARYHYPCKRSDPTRCCASLAPAGAGALAGGSFSDVGLFAEARGFG